VFASSSSTSPPRFCQPDALLIDVYSGRVVIVEVKYQHTTDAWWQLLALYVPVVRRLFGPAWEVACCEIVRWCDDGLAGTPFKLCADVERAYGPAVHICRV